jgi:hypothetical protein
MNNEDDKLDPMIQRPNFLIKTRSSSHNRSHYCTSLVENADQYELATRHNATNLGTGNDFVEKADHLGWRRHPTYAMIRGTGKSGVIIED